MGVRADAKREALKLEFLGGKRKTIKAFCDDKNIVKNANTYKKTVGRGKMKSEIIEKNFDVAKEMATDKYKEMRIKVFDNLKKTKLKALQDFMKDLVENYDKMTINERVMLYKIIKVELGEPTEINKGDLNMQNINIQFGFEKSQFDEREDIK